MHEKGILVPPSENSMKIDSPTPSSEALNTSLNLCVQSSEEERTYGQGGSLKGEERYLQREPHYGQPRQHHMTPLGTSQVSRIIIAISVELARVQWSNRVRCSSKQEFAVNVQTKAFIVFHNLGCDCEEGLRGLLKVQQKPRALRPLQMDYIKSEAAFRLDYTQLLNLINNSSNHHFVISSIAFMAVIHLHLSNVKLLNKQQLNRIPTHISYIKERTAHYMAVEIYENFRFVVLFFVKAQVFFIFIPLSSLKASLLRLVFALLFTSLLVFKSGGAAFAFATLTVII
uniref:Uncharacterized protein n=1 Tax=Glossina pallidipes TaxID=7398 RepID=A0A1A9ZTQ9_GLOPL